MKHVRTDILLPGMIVATDIIVDGQLILPKGLTLTDRAIYRLSTYNIKDIRIEDPVDMEVEEIEDEEENEEDGIASVADALLGMTAEEHDTVIPEFEEPSHFEKLKASPQYQQFRSEFTENVGSLRASLNEIVEKNTPVKVDDLIGNTMKIIASQSNTFSVFDMLHNMRDFDDLTFTHSMNVAMICNVFAQWLGMSPDEVKLATACGTLHDIGKLRIDDEIIKKPGKLTDEEFKTIQSHPIFGYRLLQNQKISEHIKLSALEHHEKCDGSGYPMHLPGDKIDRFAKLVTIADVYDAMTSNRIYRKGMCPFKVIEIFEQEGLQKYDVVFIMTFLESVVNTYIDNRVALSDGRIGTVKWINKQRLSKPMVQLENGSFLELAKNPDLSITQIL
ncbi:MAG: HD-GYP domain-containing protein [Lachnospiraceae bacterium]|nr:HD-GYP domain-containing protein [Lachnospiraceae bacterium]